jgi:hypothetical protein
MSGAGREAAGAGEPGTTNSRTRRKIMFLLVSSRFATRQGAAKPRRRTRGHVWMIVPDGSRGRARQANSASERMVEPSSGAVIGFENINLVLLLDLVSYRFLNDRRN